MGKLDRFDVDQAKLGGSWLGDVLPTGKDLEAHLKKQKKADEKFTRDLRKRAKTVKKLTIGLECLVVESHYHQRATSFTPHSEIVLDGRSPSYSGGHLYRVELMVESDSSVRKLLFNGWPHLETGDVIKAYIFKGKKGYEHSRGLIVPKNIEELADFHQAVFKDVPFHWVERKYLPVEQPSKIEKLRDGKVVATYHNR